MNYRWSEKEIADTRAYWFSHDMEVIQRRNRRSRTFDFVYYSSLMLVVSASLWLFSR